MHNKVNDTRKVISELYRAIARVNQIKTFRSAFIANPSAAMETVESVSGLDAEILTYKEVFKTDINSIVATDDAIELINTSLLTSIDELAAIESSVIPSINEIIAKVTNMIGTMSDDRMGIVAAGITKANSALPYKELFNRKLDRYLRSVIRTEGVATEEYIPWLYGIYKELKNDNIEELLSSPDFASIEKYMITAKPVSFINENIYTPAVPVYDGGNKYGLIANYIISPDSDISGLDILIAIGKLLISGSNAATSSHFEYSFNAISGVGVYKDDLVKELSDALTLTTPVLDDLLNNASKSAHVFIRVSDKVIYECTNVYDELYKRVVVFLLLVDITASNNA